MIFKVNKTSDYSIISNYHLKDNNLSLKAKGLLSIMLSLPDNWDYSVNGLVAICKENETAIKNALDELKEYGYLVINKKLPNETQSGRLEYEYNIYEKPKQEVEKQEVEKQGVENIGLVSGNIHNIYNSTNNKSITKNKELNNKENIIKEKFDLFWNEYPKKVDKKGSYKAFKNVNNILEIADKIIQDVKNKKYNDWAKCGIQYIPHPTTYLHQERWNDKDESVGSQQWFENYWNEYETEQTNKKALEKLMQDNADEMRGL